MEVFAALSVLFGLLGTVAFIIIGIVFAIMRKPMVKWYFLISAACFILMIVGAIAMPTSQPTNTAVVDSKKQVSSNEATNTPITESNKATKEASTNQGSDKTPVSAAGAEQGKVTSELSSNKAEVSTGNSYDVKIDFPVSKYPETAEHIKEAIEAGESAVCTIDRDGAEENREESLDGVPTKKGYDRDEWPMAMCAEGGSGADIEYITPADNRGAGSWVGNALEDYPDGTRVLFTFSEIAVAKESNDTATKVKSSAGSSSKASSTDKSSSTNKTSNTKKSSSNQSTSSAKTESPSTESEQSSTVYYKNCTAAREAGAAPLYKGDPGYRAKLDRDKDGVACE